MRKSCALLVLLASAFLIAAQDSRGEVRALWVQRSTMTSPESVHALVAAAKKNGFNTLLVQVRGRGDAYYRSRLEPRAALLAKQPASFDPLDLVLTEAHAAGLRVHAWMNADLISDADPPSRADHLVHAHPDWLMVPRELGAELAVMDPQSPDYVAALSRYAHANRDRIEGLYSSPLHRDAARHTAAVIADVAARYAVDGVHLDYIRFPSADFDYSRTALTEFRRYLEPRLSEDERRQFDERARREPLFYTDMFPQRWQEFRESRLTELVDRIRTMIKASRPQAILSAAVVPEQDLAAQRFQAWPSWLGRGLLDVICPMAYTTDPAMFRSQIANVRRIAGDKPVWAGIGAFQLSSLETVLNIRAARQLGVQGVILFSYDNLVGPNSDYLQMVAHDAFGQ